MSNNTCTRKKDVKRGIKFILTGHLRETTLETIETGNPCEYSQICNVECPRNQSLCRIKRFHTRHPDWRNRQSALA